MVTTYTVSTLQYTSLIQQIGVWSVQTYPLEQIRYVVMVTFLPLRAHSRVTLFSHGFLNKSPEMANWCHNPRNWIRKVSTLLNQEILPPQYFHLIANTRKFIHYLHLVANISLLYTNKFNFILTISQHSYCILNFQVPRIIVKLKKCFLHNIFFTLKPNPIDFYNKNLIYSNSPTQSNTVNQFPENVEFGILINL